MKSPFKQMDKAFCPMYDDVATISDKDGRRDTFEVSIFEDTNSEPISEDMMDTDLRVLTFVFKRDDWSHVQQIHRGDSVKVFGHRYCYVVADVKYDFALGWIVTARQYKNS